VWERRDMRSDVASEIAPQQLYATPGVHAGLPVAQPFSGKPTTEAARGRSRRLQCCQSLLPGRIDPD
jgi:hypothetical protein